MKSRLAIFLLVLLAAPLAHAQMMLERFRPNEHYVVIEQPKVAQSGPGIEVVEVYNHGCTHCFHFQPTVDKWKATLPKDVRFSYLSAPFRPDFALISRAIFAAGKLGIEEKSHAALYDYIWNQHKPVATIDNLADFYAGQGADRARFLAIAASPEADAALKTAMELIAAWGVDGTPSVIVNGKYRTAPSMTGDPDLTFEVVNFLIDKERAAAAKP